MNMTTTDKYREYEKIKRRLAAECETSSEYEERLRDAIKELGI